MSTQYTQTCIEIPINLCCGFGTFSLMYLDLWQLKYVFSTEALSSLETVISPKKLWPLLELSLII